MAARPAREEAVRLAVLCLAALWLPAAAASVADSSAAELSAPEVEALGRDDACNSGAASGCALSALQTFRGRVTDEWPHISLPHSPGSREVGGLDPDGQCKRFTGGYCRILPCMTQRGPTQCESGKCMCRVGLCASSEGTCALPQGVMKAKLVPVTVEKPKFPPSQTGLQTALCFSGGGARSLSLVMGALRALEALALMPNVDAISSVSGGTWASAIYMFANRSTEDLLGSPTQPEDLTLDALEEEASAMGSAATTNTEKIAAELVAHGANPHSLWQETMGKAFLEPFGLNSMSFMAADAAAVKRIRAANPQLGNSPFLTPQPGKPRAFVMSGALLAPLGYKASSSNVVSFQVSPDFTGSPFRPDGGPVSYVSTHGDTGPLDDVVVGGGFVETFAFGGPPPFKVSNETEGLTAQITDPTLPFTLADAVGISSAAFAGHVTNLRSIGRLSPATAVPKVNIWPVQPFAAPDESEPADKPAMRTYTMGDGGNVENTGLLAMLQRRVPRVAWWINTDTALSDVVDFCEGAPTGDKWPAGLVTNQLYDKFGFGSLASEFYAHNQVFKQEELPKVLCEFQTLAKAGRPMVVRKTFEVVPNAWWGIEASSVDLVMVYNARCSSFVDALPDETKEELDADSGKFEHFPYFRTMFQNGPLGATTLTDAQVNLLAAHAEFAVQQNAAMFKDLLGAS